MEISTIGRPRNVSWSRAAALLYGDWGTSKAYVVGLGLGLVGFSALPHLLAVSALTALVGLNYIWICKYLPSGGGVYTAARSHSRRLAIVGGLLLMADYIVTASLSCLDAFRYLGLDNITAKKFAITAIFVIAGINFLGPKHTGGIALWLAFPTMLVVICLIGAGIPHLAEFKPAPLTGGPWHNWVAFTGMILALSGVEAAASNTGVMQLDPGATPENPSVHCTSRRAISVVMVEVVVGTALLSVLAICLPADAIDHKDYLLRFMGEVFVGQKFGMIVGVVFAMLLLSAVNTAMVGLISILYVMARDREIPAPFTQLNAFGVPSLPLITAAIVPVIVLNLVDTVEGLSSLYAIGVVGAITINIGSCSFHKRISVTPHERKIMTGTFVIMLLIWLTIAATKFHALLYALVILTIGLGIREYTQRRQLRAALAPTATRETEIVSASEVSGVEPVLGGRILVAARGYTPGLQFAMEEAKLRKAQLLVLYIREIAVQFANGSDWHADPEAKKLFNRIKREAGDLQVSPLYGVSDLPAETIVDIAATFGVDTVILGGTRRATFVNLLKGNVVAHVAALLPETIRLVVIG